MAAPVSWGTVNLPPQYLEHDIDSFHAVLLTVRDIYSYSGQSVLSWQQLVDSDYYPSTRPWDITCRDLKITFKKKLNNSRNPNTLFLEAAIPQRLMNKVRANYPDMTNDEFREHIDFLKRTEVFDKNPKEVTRLKLKSYLGGVRARRGQIFLIRENFTDMMKNLPHCRKMAPDNVKIFRKPVHTSPLKHDFPRNRKELSLYEKWLCDTEGVPFLADG
jgi:hypothetical protein